jgi:WhiB family redox-sensing transcriptional regulator
MTRRKMPSRTEVEAARRDPRYVQAQNAPANARWRDTADCRKHNPDVFFPEPGGPTTYAVMVCQGCDVRANCLADALNVKEREGVIGGTTPYERAPMIAAWHDTDVTEPKPAPVPATAVTELPADVPDRCTAGAHEVTLQTLGVDKNGRRFCRACASESGKKGMRSLVRMRIAEAEAQIAQVAS